MLVDSRRPRMRMVAAGTPGALVWVAAGSILGFAALMTWTSPMANLVRDVVLYNAPFVCAAAALGARAVSERRRGREWRAWVLLSVAVGFNIAGSLFYSLVLTPMEDPPYPSWGDALYLGFYPLVYVAVVRLLRSQVARWHRSMWLDGLISAMVVGAGVVQFALGPTLDLSGGRFSVVAVNLSYPVGDVLLLGMLAGVFVVLGGRLDASWIFLSASLALLAVADVIFALMDSSGVYEEGSPIDLVFLAGALALTVAAVAGIGRAERPPYDIDAQRMSRWGLLAAPVVGTLAGTLLLSPADWWTPNPVAGWLAVAVIGVATTRTLMTYREVRSLSAARREARTDDLTGLVNRRGFLELAPQFLGETRPRTGARAATRPGAALLLLDLDGFKEVNDSLGHAAGDQLLATLAARLAETARDPGDLLARIGGDEFVMLLADAGRSGALATASRVQAALSEPVTLDGVQVHVEGSVGIALFPDHGTDPSILLRRADIAMYRAKSVHCGIAMFDTELTDPDEEDRLQRVAEIRAAIDTDELVLHYQPKIELASGEVIGVEALVRWNHPTRGLVGPDHFLPLVESAGLMPVLTKKVLNQALHQCRAWRGMGLDLVVSVNMCPVAIMDERLPDRIRALLVAHHVPARNLVLEITEESLLGDRVRARAVLAGLRKDGVSISIDDYGSGYSSLAYLRELPLDELKLDKAFVLPMAHDPRSASIVRSSIDLAHALGLRIVAEGVEDAAAAENLTSFGCDIAQGFHYSRALPADELEGWIARWREQRPTLAVAVAALTAHEPAAAGGGTKD